MHLFTDRQFPGSRSRSSLAWTRLRSSPWAWSESLWVRATWLIPIVLFVGLGPRQCAEGREPASSLAVAENPTNAVGFRETNLDYRADGTAHKRKLFLWYPTREKEERHNYRGQIGRAAADAGVAPGEHPLVVFSHGYLGAGDQAIFLMEALARHGYIVAALNHTDSLGSKRDKPLVAPKFADVRSWTDAKFRDRCQDMTALIDHLLEQDGKSGELFHARINERAIGAMGHSLGGYTVLGLAGGWESWHDKRIHAVLALSPYALPFVRNGTPKSIRVPVMIQGGTLDLGITPFLPAFHQTLTSPKYFLVLKNETHFGWTNLISLGKTTEEAVRDGNARWITDYSLAFFHQHLLDREQPMLNRSNEALKSYEFSAR